MYSVPTEPRRLTVAECLRLNPLSRGELVAGRQGLTSRDVEWVAVIEWPVEDFVAPGELVLTTGVGCDDTMFVTLVREIAVSAAAGVVIGVGHGAPFAEVSPAAGQVGDELGVPIVALPWDVRFADVMRVVVDRLLSARYATVIDARGRLPTELTDALLQPDGLQTVAATVESMIDRPALIADAGLAITAYGPRAQARLGTAALTAQRRAIENVDASRLKAIRSELGGGVHRVPPIPELLVHRGLVASARAHGTTVAYVFALDDEPFSDPLVLDRQALEQAAIAVAIEALRAQAAANAESRARDEFLCEIVSGKIGGESEITAKGRVLGYDPRQTYNVIAAEAVSGAAYDSELAGIAARLRRRDDVEGLHAVACSDHLLVLVPQETPGVPTPNVLAQRLCDELNQRALSWGVADGQYRLADLRTGSRRARQAIAVGRALCADGLVHDATELRSFMMLAQLASDPEAQREADAALLPILEYDSKHSRQLLESLTVYLEANGNTSAAARRLHLNRHGLLYRLRRIESLTNRTLDDHDDRFLLELSLRIRRMSSGGI